MNEVAFAVFGDDISWLYRWRRKRFDRWSISLPGPHGRDNVSEGVSKSKGGVEVSGKRR